MRIFVEVSIYTIHYVKFTVSEDHWKITKQVLEIVSTDIKRIIILLLPLSKK